MHTKTKPPRLLLYSICLITQTAQIESQTHLFSNCSNAEFAAIDIETKSPKSPFQESWIVLFELKLNCELGYFFSFLFFLKLSSELGFRNQIKGLISTSSRRQQQWAWISNQEPSNPFLPKWCSLHTP